MVQRWSIGRMAQYAVVCAFLAVGLVVLAYVGTSAAALVHVSTGPSLRAPVTEPGETVGRTAGMSVNQITTLYRQHALWLRARDTTRSFHVAAVVHADHSVTITEDIVQVFRNDRHGIERLIPLDTNLGHNVMRDLTVSTDSATSGAVKVTDVAGGVRVRIGDPDTTIRGAHAYRLVYVLENVVITSGNTSTVRLDAVNDWKQDIDSLHYRIDGPHAPVTAACFAGPERSTRPCGTFVLTDVGATFATTSPLPAGESFTAEVVYRPTAFAPSATVTSTLVDRNLALVSGGALFAALFVAFGITALRARRSRIDAGTCVDLTFGAPMQQTLPSRRSRAATPLPSVVAHQLPPLEFAPPLGLDPAAITRLRDGTDADVSTILAATLVDLASDGVVRLEQRSSDSGWTVHRVEQPPRGVTPYEETLLTTLLGNSAERDLDSRDKGLASAMPKFIHQVDEQLHDLGLTTRHTLHFSAESRWSKVTNTLLACLAVGFFGAVTFVVVHAYTQTKWAIIGIAVAACVTLVVMALRHDVVRVRNYTDRGRGVVWRIAGFERFFRDSEAIHAQAASRMGIHREYMGYAVAFDSLREWVGAMPQEILDAMDGEVPDDLPPHAVASISSRPLWRHAAIHAAGISASSRGGGSSGSSSSGGGFGGGGGGSW